MTNMDYYSDESLHTVMKNWQPFVSGPLLAMLRNPGPVMHISTAEVRAVIVHLYIYHQAKTR